MRCFLVGCGLSLVALSFVFTGCVKSEEDVSSNKLTLGMAIAYQSSQDIQKIVAKDSNALGELLENGQTPLVYSVSMGDLSIIKMIVELGADATEKSDTPLSSSKLLPVECAILFDEIDIVDYFLTHQTADLYSQEDINGIEKRVGYLIDGEEKDTMMKLVQRFRGSEVQRLRGDG